MSDIAKLNLEAYEQLARDAVEWWALEKKTLVGALEREKKPFSTRPSGLDEYRTLASYNWGQVVAERGLDTARKLAKRYFELRKKYGPPNEIPHPLLLDRHVSPHPVDPSAIQDPTPQIGQQPNV